MLFKKDDSELIHIYSISIFVLTLLDEWSKLERTGSAAKIYNTISRNHKNFYEQIHAVKKKKKKKLSSKCGLFVAAGLVSRASWDTVVMNSSATAISVNVVILNLYRFNSVMMIKIYGLQRVDFDKLNTSSAQGSVMQSLKIARLLNEEVLRRLSSADK